eukprot:764834-Hanusia_phi.AAC.2
MEQVSLDRGTVQELLSRPTNGVLTRSAYKTSTSRDGLIQGAYAHAFTHAGWDGGQTGRYGKWNTAGKGQRGRRGRRKDRRKQKERRGARESDKGKGNGRQLVRHFIPPMLKIQTQCSRSRRRSKTIWQLLAELPSSPMDPFQDKQQRSFTWSPRFSCNITYLLLPMQESVRSAACFAELNGG